MSFDATAISVDDYFRKRSRHDLFQTLFTIYVAIVVSFMAFVVVRDSTKVNEQTRSLVDQAKVNAQSLQILRDATAPAVTAKSNALIGYVVGVQQALCAQSGAPCPAVPKELTSP